MKKYTVYVTQIILEMIEVSADGEQEAIKFAENNLSKVEEIDTNYTQYKGL